MSPKYGNLAESMCKENLSLAYVEAVAATAGCVTSRERPDVGLDIRIRQESDVHRYSEAEVVVQVKSTKNERWADDGLVFQLPVKNYNDLRNPKVHTPRILVVMIVPEDRESWLGYPSDLTELRKYAFWVSLRGRPETTNVRTQRVALPREQRFTVDALCTILEAAGAGRHV